MNLSRALRLKKRIVENIRKLEKDIQAQNSVLKPNAGEEHSKSIRDKFALRQKYVSQLVNLKQQIQTATAPIMDLVLTLAEVKAEIAFWQAVNTAHGLQERQWGDMPPLEYVAVYSRSEVDEAVANLQNNIDTLQTKIDNFNATTTLVLVDV